MHVISKLTGLTFAAALLALSFSAVRADGSNSTPCSQDQVRGCVLTTLDGVAVYFNGWDPSASDDTYYGYTWQCVELIQRYYGIRFHYPGIWAPMYAYQTFEDWGHPATMDAYPNGSPTTPKDGDVLVFDRTWFDPYGHVALVRWVKNGKIDFVQQNMYAIGEDALPIDSHNNISAGGLYGPIRGWLRDNTPPQPPAAPRPRPTTAPAQSTIPFDALASIIIDARAVIDRAMP